MTKLITFLIVFFCIYNASFSQIQITTLSTKSHVGIELSRTQKHINLQTILYNVTTQIPRDKIHAIDTINCNIVLKNNETYEAHITAMTNDSIKITINNSVHVTIARDIVEEINPILVEYRVEDESDYSDLFIDPEEEDSADNNDDIAKGTPPHKQTRIEKKFSIYKTMPKRRKSNHNEHPLLGLTLFGTGGLNIVGGVETNAIGFRASTSLFFSTVTAVQFNILINLACSKSFSSNISLGAGYSKADDMSISLSSRRNIKFAGLFWDINTNGFFGEIGISAGSGRLGHQSGSGVFTHYQVGYLYRF